MGLHFNALHLQFVFAMKRLSLGIICKGNKNTSIAAKNCEVDNILQSYIKECHACNKDSNLNVGVRVTYRCFCQQLDPEAMRNSALVLSWLRLVQAARNGQEQNTEAFLKAGQLYVRTIRDIRPEEELLVWYDQELSHLLGFTDMSRGSSEGEAELCEANKRSRYSD